MNRHREWAIRTLVALRQQLGGKCADCGTEDSLEFDCIVPQGDKHHRWETNRRAVFYRRQHKAGNLQLLCGGSSISCHAKKSKTENPQNDCYQPF